MIGSDRGLPGTASRKPWLTATRRRACCSWAITRTSSPGGVACLEFPGVPEPGRGEIAWLLDPDLYLDDQG